MHDGAYGLPKLIPAAHQAARPGAGPVLDSRAAQPTIGPMSPMALYAYVALILLSRLAFRHRELVATGEDAPPAARPWQRGLLCLLPLALMQLGPFCEFFLRYRETMRGPIWTGRVPPSMAPGAVLFVAGTALAAVASRQLARGWQSDSGQLVTSGLYSCIRHPMYAGYLVQGAGCLLMLGSLWSWLLYGPAVALIFVRIVTEDRELAGLFPEEFPGYRARVKRLGPWVL
jgi:protein-S-isoprenylcysteine O-methyltransferase Ste14